MFRITVLSILILLASCTNKTIYSGKILNQEDLTNINFKNKQKLIEKIGNPSFIDPIENKYFYYSKKTDKKSIFNKKTMYDFVFVFEFDETNKIVSSKVYDLKNRENINLVNDETDNEVVKRGLLERIFGGVGPQQGLPTTP